MFMKRSLLFLAVILSAIVLSGCSKELKSLSGTVWEKNESGLTVTLSFTKIQCERKMVSNYDPSDYETSYYSYEYDASIVMMYPEDEKNAALKGIISDNTMSVVNLSTEKTIGIFRKR